MVPAKASNSNFEGEYLKNYLIRVQNAFSKSNLHFPNKHTGQLLTPSLTAALTFALTPFLTPSVTPALPPAVTPTLTSPNS